MFRHRACLPTYERLLLRASQEYGGPDVLKEDSPKINLHGNVAMHTAKRSVLALKSSLGRS